MNNNMKMTRGDTYSFGFEYKIDDESTQDLETCYFSCKKNSDDENYIFQKSLDNGISKVANGQYRIRVAPEDTEEIEAGNYFYDLEIGLNEDKFTLLKGILRIETDVTRGGN